LVLGFWIFLLSTTFADVFARMNIGGEAFDVALSDSLYWSAVQWVGTIMLLAPFVLVAMLAASVARITRPIFGVLFLALFSAILFSMYFSAHQASQEYMIEKMWTAAALSVGLLPFRAIPLVAVGVLLRWLLFRLFSGERLPS
jgi:hypothetical protein